MTTLPEKTKRLLLSFIEKYDTFVIAGHKEPDGDCIGSSLALGSLLKRMGKKTVLLSAGPFKRIETRVYKPLFSAEFNGNGGSTGVFIVDCSTLLRTGSLEPFISGLPSFIIDHHKTSVCETENCLIVPEAPATAYLVQLIIESLDGRLTKEEAELLLFGLCTDTGYFRFLDSSSADVFRAVARLADAGADPGATYITITGGKPFGSRKLLGQMLDRAAAYCGGRLILTWETLEDSQKYGLDNRDSDTLYQLLFAIEGVQAIASVRQETTETCTAGLRSRGDLDVSGIAAAFGGGGHKNAAGLGAQGKLEDIIPQILEKFEKLFASFS